MLDWRVESLQAPGGTSAWGLVSPLPDFSDEVAGRPNESDNPAGEESEENDDEEFDEGVASIGGCRDSLHFFPIEREDAPAGLVGDEVGDFGIWIEIRVVVVEEKFLGKFDLQPIGIVADIETTDFHGSPSG